MPAQAYALTHFKLLDAIANGGNCSDHFVAGDKRILADSPIVRDEVDIAVANAAMGDGNLDLLRTQRSWIVVVREEFGSRRVRCKSLNFSHVILRSSLEKQVNGKKAAGLEMNREMNDELLELF